MLTTCLHWLRALARTAWWPICWKGAAWAGACAAVAHVGSHSLSYLTPSAAIGPPALERIALAAQPSAPPSAASAEANVPCPAGAKHSGDAFDARGRLRLNAAGVDDLDKLPGIGKKRAEAIVALRERIGRFRHLRDLMRVRGIGFRSLKRLEPLVTLEDPPPPAATDDGAPQRR